MAMTFQLKDFDGPLDLLLHLVTKAQIDIRDIFVSEITDQYIAAVRSASDLDMDDASEFLVMAATLLEIKSRAMLPRPPAPEEGEEDPEAELIRRLEEYKRFKETAIAMQGFENAAKALFTKLPDEFPLPPQEVELVGLTLDGLTEALRRILARKPSAEEMQLLEQAFSRQGFTQGYFDGDKKDMFGIRQDTDRADESVFANARKGYAEGELRRVPVHFYTVAEKGVPIRAIAFDDEGHKAVTYGAVPERAKRQGLTSGYLTEQMFKTGGTPYSVVENRAKADPGLFLSASEINRLRRDLVSQLSEERAKPPVRGRGPMPQPPRNVTPLGDPKIIFQVRSEDQLTEELAALKPDYLYVPAQVMAEHYERVLPYIRCFLYDYPHEPD